ncbi:classical arabinogalactan protein 25 [Impatiens glandulifera]|uniref:classical arabinogalactan protein 25 n=1 Tax=Impatiens glandulifera TaxID=253017 RepID=UPI001FB07C25|nr:classical arabinogalactan protein 25 [Impatiens glandulifera]
MACFLFFTAFIMVLMISPALCFSISLLKFDTPAVVVLPDHPLSPFKGGSVPSPDISPLLPSPFGSSSSSSIIPSNPSPPNPDEVVNIFAPDSSFSPAGAPLSSSSSLLYCSDMVSLLVVTTILFVLVV